MPAHLQCTRQGALHFKSKSNTQEHTDDEPFHPRETEKNGGSTCRVHLGGVLVAAGSSGMAQAPGGASAQASLLLYFSGTQQAGSLLELKDATGKTLAAYTPEKSYQSAAFSAPGMAVGETYSVYVDGEKAAEVTLTYRHGETTITQVVRLVGDRPEFEVVFDIDWHERQQLLKWDLPLDVQADQAVRPTDRRRIDIRPVEAIAHMHTPRHRFEATADSGQSIGRRARSLFLAAHRLRDRLAVLADPVIDSRAGLVDLESVGDIQFAGNRSRVQNAEHILRFRGHSGAGGIFRLARGCRSPGCYGEGHRA